MTTATALPDSAALEPRPVHPAVAVILGVASALVGLIPWLVTGRHLPLQNLWDTDALPDDMPLVLLPLGNYTAAETSALLMVGAAIAGACVAVGRALGRTISTRLTLTGLLIVQFGVLAHAALMLGLGLGDNRDAHLYLGVLVGGALLTIGLGVAVMLAIAHGQAPGATVAIAAAAVALNEWLTDFVVAVVPTGWVVPAIVWHSVSWLPAIVTGIAIGWCGFRTAGRALASVGALLIIWIGPAFVTAISYGLGSRIYLQYPEELFPASRQVFWLALGSGGQAPERIIVTVVVAILAWLAFAARDRMRGAAGEAESEAASARGPEGDRADAP